MMRFVFVLIVLVAGVAALGYYQGWFTVSTDGKQEVNMKLDREKLKEDEDKAKAKLEGLKGQVQDKVDEHKKDAPAKTAGDGRK